jgi:hypothetical protein
VSQTGKVIRTLLTGDATITSLVGTKVRMGRMDQVEDYPAIVFKQVSTMPNDHKLGTSVADQERWQVSAFAESYAEAYEIADRIRFVLDGVNQQVVNGVDVDGVMFLDETALPYDDETDTAQVAHDYQIRVRR